MSITIYYLKVLPDIREAARRHGYAIGLHGSMERDLDLIAAPWQDIVSPPDVLVQAVAGALNRDAPAHPARKPHGRLAWSIQLGGGAYIDLSIMPVSPSTEGD